MGRVMDSPYRVHAPLNFSSWLREPSYTPSTPPPVRPLLSFQRATWTTFPNHPKGEGGDLSISKGAVRSETRFDVVRDSRASTW